MNVVADTHTWIWAVTRSSNLSNLARTALESADIVLIPAICMWEVAMLDEKGKVEAMNGVREFFEIAFVPGRMELVPLTPAIAARSAELGPGVHGDPADRLIAATALELSLPLVTRDQRLTRVPGLQVVW